MVASEIGDAELVAGALRGDRSAFATLIERHQAGVRLLVRRLLADPYEAEDVTQESILQAYLSLPRLRDPERFGSWLAGIAVNLAKMRIRRGRSPLETTGGRRIPVGFEGSGDPTPQETLEAAELLEIVREAVAVLPPGERNAVLMYYVDGLSCREIAALTGVSTGAVRVRLHRARGRLREQLAALAPLEPIRRKEMALMIEVEVEDVITRVLPEEEGGALPRLADERLRVVLLREKGGDRLLPIWVGAQEGDALAMQLASGLTPRPLTADLMARLLEATGGTVERVSVSSLREQTFYAVVTVTAGGESRELDARPSDALNLAARVGAPIFVDDAVLAEAGTAAGDVPGCLDEEEARFRGAAGEGEWRSMSPELVLAHWERPRTEPER